MIWQEFRSHLAVLILVVGCIAYGVVGAWGIFVLAQLAFKETASTSQRSLLSLGATRSIGLSFFDQEPKSSSTVDSSGGNREPSMDRTRLKGKTALSTQRRQQERQRRQQQAQLPEFPIGRDLPDKQDQNTHNKVSETSEDGLYSSDQ